MIVGTKFIAVLGIVSVAGSFSAYADTTTTAAPSATSGSSVTEVSSTQDRDTSILDKVYLNYLGVYHGASFKDPGSVYSVGPTGKTTKAGVFFDSELTAAYMVSSDFGIGPVVPFFLFPVMGQGFSLGDVGVKAFDKQLVSYRGFNLSTNLVVQAPTSAASQAVDMSFAVKTVSNMRYSFRGTPFTVGAWTEAKTYLGVTRGRTFKLYAAPYVNYSLAKNLSLNLLYESLALHSVGDQGVDFTSYQTDFQPGFVWNITPRILVNPYVQVFTNTQNNSDRAAMGAVISATML